MPKQYLIDFSIPETVDQLIAYVGCPAEIFLMVLGSDSRAEFYIQHDIPKRSARRRHERRIVWEAPPPLSEAHKTIARRFDVFARTADVGFPHESAFGYVRHRNTRDNARVHCGAKFLLRADIRNFFPSISLDRLTNRFLTLNMNLEPAAALAKFVTINDELPLGLNSSPTLANLVALGVDEKLSELASKYGCKYTRYADDIAISSSDVLPTKNEVVEILESEKFQLATEKFRITRRGQAHYVTGLSISDEDRPHVPRHMKRRLRQEVYYSKKFGVTDHLDRTGESRTQRGINRLDGMVRYVNYIEGRSASPLKENWHALLKRDELQVSYQSHTSSKSPPSITCYVDETEFYIDGEAYLALGLIFTDEPEVIEGATASLLKAFQKSDPFYAGDRVALAKSGIHFVDAHFDLRATYIKLMESFSLRAFVVFGRLKDVADYENCYLALLGRVLPQRLVKYNRICVNFIFEENSKIKKGRLERAVQDIYGDLSDANSKRPLLAPNVSIESKKSVAAFSAPDFMLAIFSRYAQLKKFPKEPLREHQFERLRDKYRLIIDADSNNEFSRRRPFGPFS
jgi:RNA-directed DNA polymerase